MGYRLQGYLILVVMGTMASRRGWWEQVIHWRGTTGCLLEYGRCELRCKIASHDGELWDAGMHLGNGKICFPLALENMGSIFRWAEVKIQRKGPGLFCIVFCNHHTALKSTLELPSFSHRSLYMHRAAKCVQTPVSLKVEIGWESIILDLKVTVQIRNESSLKEGHGSSKRILSWFDIC